MRRPVLIVQADGFNRSRIATVIVAAITSNLALAAASGNVRLTRTASGLPKPSVVDVSILPALGTRCAAAPSRSRSLLVALLVHRFRFSSRQFQSPTRIASAFREIRGENLPHFAVRRCVLRDHLAVSEPAPRAGAVIARNRRSSIAPASASPKPKPAHTPTSP